MLRLPTNMKYIAFFILSTLTIDLFAQSFELPPDNVIKKNRIKTITTYFNDDSIKNELSEVWKFDLDGKLISKQLFDNEDTTLSIDLYFYKDNLLMEYWSVGTWTEYDTVKTTYFYDNQNRKIKVNTEGKFNPFNGESNGFINTTSFTYLNDSIVVKKYEGNALTARGSGIDSIIYNKDKTIKYLFNNTNNLKYSYYYNHQKQLLSEILTSIHDPFYIYRYCKYFYENGRLLRETLGLRKSSDEKEEYSETEYYYIYDNKGLFKEIKRPLNFDTYKYEFYE